MVPFINLKNSSKFLLNFIFLFFFLILPQFVVSFPSLSEVMYNPSTSMGSDSDLEWLELYFSEDFCFNECVLKINSAQYSVNDGCYSKNDFLLFLREYEDSSDADTQSFNNYYYNFSGFFQEIKFSLSNSDALIELLCNPNKINNESNNNNTESNNNASSNIIKTIFSEHYFSSQGADGNGYSLVFSNFSIRESEIIGGSPGYFFVSPNQTIIQNNSNNSISPINITLPNNITINESSNSSTNNNSNQPIQKLISLSIALPDKLFLGEEYSSLFTITNEAHVSGTTDYEDVSIKYNISSNNILKVDFLEILGLNYKRTSQTGSFIPLTSGNYTICGEILTASSIFSDSIVCKDFIVLDPKNIPCDYSISMSFPDKIVSAGQKVSYKFFVNSSEDFPFTINYWISDVFGNIIQQIKQTSNTNSKSFTPKLFDEPDKVLILNGEISPLCNDKNQEDNFVSEFLIVTSKQTVEATKSSCKFVSLSKKEIFPSDIFHVTLEFYKGDTTKTVLKSYVILESSGKKVSQDSKIYFNEKFQTYEFALPILLNDFELSEDSKAFIVVEGLDVKDKYSFIIKSNSQPTKNISKNLSRENFNNLLIKNLQSGLNKTIKPIIISDQIIENSSFKNQLTGAAASSYPENVSTNKAFFSFISSSQKAKLLLPIFLSLIGVLIFLIFLGKLS